MSASVSGPEHTSGSSNAVARELVRPSAVAAAAATAAALFVAALAAAPARAADPGGSGLSPTTVDSPLASYGSNGGGGAVTPPPNPVDTIALADNARPTPTAPQDSTATNTQTTSTAGGAGGRATGGNAGPSHVVDGSSQGGSHGGIAYANGGNAESHTTLDNVQSHRTSGRDSSWSGTTGDKKNGGGRDGFVVETTKPRHSGGAAAVTNRARFPGLFELGDASRSTQLEAKGRRGHETAKVSPLGGVPGHGGRLPSQNPFFYLLSAPGGASAGLMLLLLAVLGASIALPNERYKAFRTRTAPWRPLAYVPPIELPG